MHTWFFSNLKIGPRLLLGFALVLILLVLLTVIGVNQVSKINKSFVTISDVNGVKQRYAINFRGSVHNRAIALRDVVLESGTDAIAKQIDQISTLADLYAKSAKPLDALFASSTATTPEEIEDLQRIKAVEARTIPLTEKVIALRLAHKETDALELLLNQARPAYSAWLDSINMLIDLEEKMNQVESAKARSIAESFQTLMLGVCLIAVMFGGLIGWLISRSIVAPLKQAMALAGSVASGDLHARIHSSRADETGQLLQILNGMCEKLSSIVMRVRASSEEVGNVARDLAKGNDDLSERTQHQASALEETSASMQEISEAVKDNAAGAKQASDLALLVRESAEEGMSVSSSAVNAMNEITVASKKINDIVGLIDEIAFQTNILALNAAVESARAGEQGRGFAVVAVEVRTLAHRSASAAKDIKALIRDSAQCVEQGAKLVELTGTELIRIVEGIRSVTSITENMARASAEQSNGISQVNNAMASLDSVTQQNAALVDEASAASRTAIEVTSQLLAHVAYFRAENTPA